MRYVLMFGGTMDEQMEYDSRGKAEQEAARAAVMQWFEEHGKAGRIVGGEELRGPDMSTTVRRKNGQMTVVDGPFTESKEVVGGFAVIEVKDLDEALAMAKSWPGGNMVEVRPVVEH